MPKILKTKKRPKKQNKYLLAIASVLNGLVFFSVGFFLLSLMVYKVKDAPFYYWSVYGFIALGAFTAGYICYKKFGGRGIICGLVSSVAFMVILFIVISALLSFEITHKILLIVPVCLVFGLVGGILSANR